MQRGLLGLVEDHPWTLQTCSFKTWFYEDLEAAWGVEKPKATFSLILVPPQQGKGSEVSPVAIITIGEEEKKGVSS
ncbi:MAG: hypothetical protein Ct9H300mP5_0830 [Candidatus Pelagibacterales bacterium]|nr:MAG: hypothetical protein Ct9H300mP5_0830 [Pelagibacterales bacterium]